MLALRFDPGIHRVKLAVAPRTIKPYAGRLALPGVILLRGESLSAATRRAAKTKLGLSGVLACGQLTTFDEPHRDPRGPALALATWAVVDHDALGNETNHWVDLDDVPTLAFDHNQIVSLARPLLAGLLWRNRDFTEALTGPRFPVAHAVALQTCLVGRVPDRGNLNRLLRTTPGVDRTKEVRQIYGAGRPSSVWAWG